MKKTLIFIAALLCFKLSYAGLITHTDYTPGNVITAAGQNANENTIVNEFNGNIDNTNIKTGGITSANILDGTIVEADLSPLSQSSKYASYRRPVLVYINGTNVDVENNTATANQTCVIFTDGTRRCVTENTSSTNQYRRLTTSAQAVFVSGTEDSGMAPGETIANNEWLAVYAVKSQINASNFVLAATTNTYRQSNMSLLDTLFGTNGWVYLGTIRLGNNGSQFTNAVIPFVQTGNNTVFTDGERGGTPAGIIISSAASTSSNVTYSESTGFSGSQIPSSITQVYWNMYMAATTAVTYTNVSVLPNNGLSQTVCILSGKSSVPASCNAIEDPSIGIKFAPFSTDTLYIILTGYWDIGLSGNQTGY